MEQFAAMASTLADLPSDAQHSVCAAPSRDYTAQETLACEIWAISEEAEDAEDASDSRGERPAGRAQLLAKKGASGRMQRPPELVPIPEYLLGTSLVPPEGFGKLRKVAAFWKNPEKNWSKF